jgi:hypothetical protein
LNSNPQTIRRHWPRTGGVWRGVAGRVAIQVATLLLAGLLPSTGGLGPLGLRPHCISQCVDAVGGTSSDLAKAHGAPVSLRAMCGLMSVTISMDRHAKPSCRDRANRGSQKLAVVR